MFHIHRDILVRLNSFLHGRYVTTQAEVASLSLLTLQPLSNEKFMETD